MWESDGALEDTGGNHSRITSTRNQRPLSLVPGTLSWKQIRKQALLAEERSPRAQSLPAAVQMWAADKPPHERAPALRCGLGHGTGASALFQTNWLLLQLRKLSVGVCCLPSASLAGQSGASPAPRISHP